MISITIILGSILFLLSDNERIQQFNKHVAGCISCCEIDDVVNKLDNYPHSKSEEMSQSNSISFVSTTSNRSSTNTIIPFKEGPSNVTCEGEIGTWTRGELLGSGSFGHVWLAIDHRRGRMFAVKQVRMIALQQQLHQSGRTMEKIKQLENEIRTVSRLHHKNIVQYLGSCRTPTMMNIYLEFVPAGSIENLIRIYGPLDCDLLQELTRDVLAGLSFLHSRNIVHRDVKGANILLDHNGTCKLADFGGARELINCASEGNAKSIHGTINWMAPEIITQSGHSLAADVWSLGCTIIEMATGQLPWTAKQDSGPKSGYALMLHIANSDDIPYIPTWLPDECMQLIKSCLQRLPSKRSTAQELINCGFFQLENFSMLIYM